ncbi:MAG: phosphotyrosine protein phosphatase [Thiomonas sp. 20-64-5]|nr:MAG: phosphotyrosine protein phosphatase [Thiomonas sp. 20-64-5]
MTSQSPPAIGAENTFQVFDWLWSSGQPSADDIRALPLLGVDVVINLALPTSSNALPGEAELVAGQGMSYVQIPVLWEHPKPEQFAQFAGVLNAYAQRKVWLHCAKNMRASAFIYLYRKLILEETEEQSRFPMRHIWSPNAIWRAWIDSVCAAHTR